MRAKLMRFYGMRLSEYDRMSIQVRNELWEAITIIEAQECLTKLTIATFPKLKQGEREKVHKNFHKQAYPGIYSKTRKSITAEELQARLSRGKS